MRVRAADGAEGWGQVAPYNADLTALVLRRQVAPHALGRDATDLAAIETAVLEREHKFAGSLLVRALGGLDTALWDLRGRREGKSVCEQLGGTIRPFPAYASSMRRDIEPHDEADRLVRLRDERAFRAFKVRGGTRTAATSPPARSRWDAWSRPTGSSTSRSRARAWWELE